jgi:hypothetical protein
MIGGGFRIIGRGGWGWGGVSVRLKGYCYIWEVNFIIDEVSYCSCLFRICALTRKNCHFIDFIVSHNLYTPPLYFPLSILHFS